MSETRLTDAAPVLHSQESARLDGSKDSLQGAGGDSKANEPAPADFGAIGQKAVSQAQEQAVKIVGQAREQVTANVTTHTARAAGIAGVLGTALHDAGKQLREQDDSVATYFDQAADQVEQISSMLDTQDYGQLIATVQGYARRQPVLFFTAAVAVGVVASRFLKSSSSSKTDASQSLGPDAYGGSSSAQRSNGMREESYA